MHSSQTSSRFLELVELVADLVVVEVELVPNSVRCSAVSDLDGVPQK